MNPNKLILIGGGGHCKSCIDVIEQEQKHQIAGILDQEGLRGQKVLGFEIIGTDDQIDELISANYTFLITVGQIKSARIRKKIFDYLTGSAAILATITSPRSYVSPHAVIGTGTIVMSHAFVNAGARIGANTILNTGCIIEHDAVIGNHSHISTHAVVNGDCLIGNEVFIGSNSIIANQIEIGSNIVVGAGSVVTKTINEPGIYVGNPARKIA